MTRPTISFPITLVDQENPGHSAQVLTHVRHRVSTVTLREDALIMVRSGRKSLVSAGATLHAMRGQGVLVARGTQWDVINDPAGEGLYEAQVLSFSDALVRDCAAILDTHEGTGVRAVAAACELERDVELSDAVQRAAFNQQAAKASPALRRHRMLEVLLLLAERGHRFTTTETIGWDDRVRRLVAQRPYDAWSVDTVAAAFHVSASSLQQRLAGHGLGVAAVVREVRLETALDLLQSTMLPIGEVAQRCGWASHSRFSAAFLARWGFAPSILRAGLTQNGQKLQHSG